MFKTMRLLRLFRGLRQFEKRTDISEEDKIEFFNYLARDDNGILLNERKQNQENWQKGYERFIKHKENAG